MLTSTQPSPTQARSPQARSQGLRLGLISGILALSLITGCGQLARFGIGTTPIQQVVSNPPAHTNVTVRGQVVNTLGILGQGVYELKDDTGSLWVITGERGMPAISSTVTVRGEAAEGITISGRNFGVTLTEKERF